MAHSFDLIRFGQRLRALRKGLSGNVSIEEFASQLRTSPSLVGHWERGQRMPGLDDVFRLSKVFSVSSDYLLGLSLYFLVNRNPKWKPEPFPN